MSLLVESEKDLKNKYEELEKKLQENEKDIENRIVPPSTESGEQSLMRPMSQVSFKELEIVELWKQNTNLIILYFNREQENNPGF